MRAISAFSFEAGTSSFWWRERIALRMRVRKSATGSVKLMLSPSSSVRSGLYIDQVQRTSEDGVAGRARHVQRIQNTLRVFPTRTTSQRPESRHARRARGNTDGIRRTCAETRGGGRI